MQRQIILLLSLSLVGTFAQADLKKKIDSVNPTVQKAGAPQPFCANCYVAGTPGNADDGSLMQSCVESICQNSQFSLSGTLNKVYSDSLKSDDLFQKEIAPLIGAIAREDANDKLSRGKLFLDWLKTAPDLKSPGAVRAFNLMMALQDLSKFKMTEENGMLVIDQAKSRAAFPDLKDEEFQKSVKIGNKIMQTFLKKPFADTDPGQVQLFYPGALFKKKLNEEIASMQEMKKKIIADPELKFLSSLEAFRELALPEKILGQFATDQINPDAIEEVNGAHSVLSLFMSLATDPEFKKVLSSESIDIKKVTAKLGTEKILKDRIAKQEDFISGKIYAASTKCQIAYAMAQEILPAQKDLNALKTRILEMKERFGGKTKSLVCEESLQKFQEQFETWAPNLPLSREQFLENLKASLNRELQESKKWNAEIEEIKKSPHSNALIALSISSLREDKGAVTSTSDEVCENSMPNMLPDATSMFSSRFVVGPLVAKHAESEGICHHELGHKLFHFLKYDSKCANDKWMTNVRSCLLSNHTDLTPEEMAEQNKLLANGDKTKYESEDFADLIASQVDPKSHNFACLFTRKASKAEYQTMTLKNLTSSDPHSSDLFRLLHMNFLKTGKIPPVCEAALALKGEKASFKNCFAP